MLSKVLDFIDEAIDRFMYLLLGPSYTNSRSSFPYTKKWRISDGLALIRAAQPYAHSLHYHLCLGGGVLNKGWSHKDLDIFALPFRGDAAFNNRPLEDRIMIRMGHHRQLLEFLQDKWKLKHDWVYVMNNNGRRMGYGGPDDQFSDIRFPLYRSYIDGRRIEVFFYGEAMAEQRDAS
jgi:hypothetical protein